MRSGVGDQRSKATGRGLLEARRSKCHPGTLALNWLG